MERNKPIGIFDSGVGGLTVMGEIRKLMPAENLVYAADSAYAPYGNKDNEMIVERSIYLADFMIKYHNIKALVVACNTATAAAISTLRERLAIPVIGVEPGLKPAVATTKSGVVGILATENTLKSDKFMTLVNTHQHQARIISQPCTGLVEAIERGELDSEETRQLLSKYTRPLLDAGADVLVLGCTHYPLVEKVIQELAGEHVHIKTTGRAVARRLLTQLEEKQVVSLSDEQGLEVFYTSGEEKHVSQLASKLLARDVVFKPL